MSSKSSLIEAIESDKENQTQLLQRFIQAASPNPPGDTEVAAAVLGEYLSSKNIPYTLVTPQSGKPNVIAEFQGGRGDRPRVVLNGHIDVFPVGDPDAGWPRDPWSGDIEGDRIYGRGVVDMKSGTASLISAYSHLYAIREHLKGSVTFCAVSDEETGGRWGTKHLIENDPEMCKGDLMLSAEPSGKTIRFSEKGTLRLSGSVRTKGAHGAYLNLSKGAIREAVGFLSKVIDQVESMEFEMPPEMASHMTNPEVLAVVDKVMGKDTSTIIARPTVNIGTIGGGLKVNMIPDTCLFELDIRLPIGLVAKDVLVVIDSIIRQHKNATIEVKVQEAASNPPSYSHLSHPMVELLAKNAESLESRDRTVAIPSMGATDCKHYRYAGVPAFVYGCSPFSKNTIMSRKFMQQQSGTSYSKK
ncbi:unnamed protein product [Clonostachys rosea]|uniref:Peptidase M20 dimerisation domain-containing protein n=1 Tax=Bionectria ochroleuca TaxID=29856 RepID=A0ABY6UDW9_BIOOC|nr:unnamed protein product [Clonostachys rosea]